MAQWVKNPVTVLRVTGETWDSIPSPTQWVEGSGIATAMAPIAAVSQI